MIASRQRDTGLYGPAPHPIIRQPSRYRAVLRCGGAVAEAPRILVFSGPDAPQDLLTTPPPPGEGEGLLRQAELVRVTSLAETLARLQSETFAGVYLSTRNPDDSRRAASLLQSEMLLQVLG